MAAWLVAREHFKTVIPYCIVFVPHLGFVDRSLAYYEQFFGTKILRFLNGDPLLWFCHGWWQWFDDHWDVLSLPLPYGHTYASFPHLLRRRYNCPKAFLLTGEKLDEQRANGRSGPGSNSYIARKLRRTQGWEGKKKELFPVWNWSDEDVLNYIRSQGCKLAEDYQFSPKSIHDIPDGAYLESLRSYAPDDWQKITTMFPLIGSRIVRNQLRCYHFDPAYVVPNSRPCGPVGKGETLFGG